MARRKSAHKELWKLIEAGVALSVIFVLISVWSATGSVFLSFGAAGGVIGLFIAIMIAVKLQKAEKLKRSGIHEIDKMGGFKFEEYLSHLFRAHGYKAEVTKGVGDYGADLIITKGGRKIAVQAKRYKSNVGIKAVQEAHSSKDYYNAHESWVVTNSSFTEAARNLSSSTGVKLIDREQLIGLILESKDKGSKKITASSTSPKKQVTKDKFISKNHICKKCNSEMMLRKSKKGLIYVCSTFPKCNYHEMASAKEAAAFR